MKNSKKKWIDLIPADELRFASTRSGGPGGQHVNKTNSAVILKFNLKDTKAFAEQDLLRIFEILESRLTSEGDLVVRSQDSRDQLSNKKQCLLKLEDLLSQAHYRQPHRKKTRPTRSSQLKRLESKGKRAEIKKGRGRQSHSD